MVYSTFVCQKRKLLPIVLATLFSIGFIQCKSPSQTSASSTAPIRTLMVGGGSSHDFDRWYKQEDAQALQREGLATVTYTSNTDSILYLLPTTDVLFLSNNQPIKSAEVRAAIMQFANAGKGLVLAHPAIWYNWRDWPEYNKELVSGGSRSHDRYGTFDVNVIDGSHPITKGVASKFTLKDELYHFRTDSSARGITILANANVAGSDKVYPSVFVVNHPSARIVGMALGHDAESHTLPEYQQLIRNAVKWAARK